MPKLDSSSKKDENITDNVEPEILTDKDSNNDLDNEPKEMNIEEAMLVKQQNDELNTKIAELEDMAKRQQAEFDNFRKRNIK